MKYLPLIAIACGLLAGALQGIQPAVNATLARYVHHPLQASWISFTIGFCFIALVCLGMGIFPPRFQGTLSSLPWWGWTGGLIGAVMVTCSLLLAPYTGAANWVALIVAGQVLSTLLLDHFGLFGFAMHPINGMRIVGAALLIAGVVVVSRW
jgi:transporter family-2 protein